MEELTLANECQWAEANFGGACLHDARRSRRLPKIAAALASNPSGSVHAAMSSWSELMAAYRLMAQEDVTLDTVTQPHRNRVREACGEQGESLLIEVTTELDYGSYAATTGWGRIGNESAT